MTRPRPLGPPQKSAEVEPCDCTKPVGMELTDDWGCARARPLRLLGDRFARARRVLPATQRPHARPFRHVSTATARDYDPMWAAIRAEAQADADAEPLLSSFLYASILSHASFDKALSYVLATRLGCAQLPAAQLAEICNDVLDQTEEARCSFAAFALILRRMMHAMRLTSLRQVRLAARCDLSATRARDPACRTHADCLLYFKVSQCR